MAQMAMSTDETGGTGGDNSGETNESVSRYQRCLPILRGE